MTDSALAASSSALDPNSLANIDRFQVRISIYLPMFNPAKVKHIHLDWSVDFDAKQIKGRAELQVERLALNATDLVLDTSQLHVENVFLLQGKDKLAQKLPWSWGLKHEKFGQSLRIDLKDAADSSSNNLIAIDYITHPDSSALQWLTKDQTHSRKYPYLFTQCQAIHARSLLPCQDTPAVKFPYTAKVKCPIPLVAVMSALLEGRTEDDISKTVTFEFSQPVPIPSYLIALGVGNLAAIDIGPRSTIWSEPGMVEKGALEFEETEKFISTAEDLISPYCWSRYDLLLLPPSFPYGGMENPCLTFVTPTIVAGDRSLVDVVAHEISHSWAGNLVTNKNWQHFWLNEGFCVFIERKIIGRLYGELEKQLHAINGWKSLEESIKLFGKDNPLTSLVVNLKNIDPDDAFSSVPYEKGFNFLNYLETILGGPAVFEPYVKAYYANFAQKSITTDDWKSFLFEYIKNNHPEKVAILESVDWNSWLHTPGMPPVEMPFDRTLANACTSLAEKWNSSRSEKREANIKEFTELSTGQKMVFLDTLISYDDPFSHEILEHIDSVYGLTLNENSEVRFRWCQLCLRGKYEKIFDLVKKFITSQGRMKFVRPLYRSLSKAGSTGKQLAVETFKAHSKFYHPICASLIAKDIGLQ